MVGKVSPREASMDGKTEETEWTEMTGKMDSVRGVHYAIDATGV